jgi:hypothetical protein
MKALCTLATVTLFAIRSLAGQDTTQTPTPAPAPAPVAVTVTDAVVADSVVDRQPRDSGASFPANVGQLVCWSVVTGGSGAAIHHVWFHGDTQVGDVELQVGGSPWRTWSRKTIPADWTGAWHVEVRDAGGAVLKRVDFTVGQ